jgi:hypothetical protein
MNKSFTAPQTTDEYMSVFRQVAGIVNAALDFIQSQQGGELPGQGLHRAAEGVEFIASLRGDSGIFESTRPEGLSDFQSEMYATEDALRKRLLELGYKYPVR